MTARTGILQALRDVDSLPTLPQIYQAIAARSEDPSASAADLGKILSGDQALTARVLKLVNSAFFGLPTEISSITRAIVVLGFHPLKQLVLASSVVKMFDAAPGKGLDPAKFWEHSLATAILAKAIGREIRHGVVEDLFVGGLLHDVGKLVLVQEFHKDYSAALERIPRDCRYVMEAETLSLGIEHAEIGETLAGRWRLPKNLRAMIRYHHHPRRTSEFAREAAVVHVADAIATGLGWGSGGNRWTPPIDRAAFDSLGVPLARVAASFESSHVELQELTGILMGGA